MIPLEDGCYYVGTTVNLNKRYSQHAAGTGAAWTKLHPPLGRELVQSWQIPNMSLFQVEQMEDVFTVAMQKKYGLNNVRGGLHSPNANAEKASAAPHFAKQLLPTQARPGPDSRM